MKKLVLLLLSVFVLAGGITVYAEDGFVSSPSGGGPSLITGVISHPDCDAHIVVTPYSQRSTLGAEALAALEAAFAELEVCADLSQLNAGFASYVSSLGLAGAELAVSDVFDIDYVGCTLHETHGSYSVTLSATNLGGFVGLLHRVNGVWEFVDNAAVSGDTLSFTVSALSPFAIVVKTAEEDLLYGDVNFDGLVNSIDAAQVLMHDADLITIHGKAFTVGDVTGDGMLNSLDAAQILKYDAELITVFPVERTDE